MRERFTIRLLLALGAALGGGCKLAPYEAEESFSLSMPVSDATALSALTKNGKISFDARDADGTIRVSGRKFARSDSPAAAQELAEAIEIVCDRESGTGRIISVRAIMPEHRDWETCGADVRITAPSRLSLDLETRNGSVSVEGAEAGAAITTSNGRVAVVSGSGPVRVKTSNATVEIRQVDGDLDISTSNGRIEIVDAGRNEVRGTTTNAQIRAVQLRGNVDLRTSNGKLEAEIEALPDVPRVSAISSNGSVRVELPSDTGAQLLLKTSNSPAELDWDGGRLRELRTQPNRVKAVLGDGRGSVDIASSNAKVSLESR